MSTYVVGVDGSIPSEAALAWTLARASALDVPVVLAHVIEDEWGLVGGDFAREAAFAGQDVLRHARERAHDLAPGIEVESRLLHGSPVWELAHTCATDDMLVVGTHKTGYLHGRVLGSRSVAVAGTALCSVMVIPVIPPGWRHGVVVGVMASAGMGIAVASAAREAERVDEPLTLLHASPTSADPDADPGETRARQRELLKSAVAVAREVAPHVPIYTRVSSRRPVEALLDASHDARLLVVEPSRRAGPERSMVGSTTHDVLMNITSPVLVARGAAT